MHGNGGTPLRVGYVVKTYPRLSETFVLNEILGLEERGVAVTIFALKRPGDSRFHEKLARVRGDVLYAPDIRATNGLDFLFRHAASLAEEGTAAAPLLWDALADRTVESFAAWAAAVHFAPAVQARGLQHLHAHFATSAAASARALARLTGISYTLTAHAKDIFHESVRADDLHRKIASAHAAVAVSDWSAEYLRDLVTPADRGRVRRIYNGIDLREFPATPCPIAGRPPLLAAIGRLVPKKGFPTLLDAVALLAARGVRVPTVLVGDGEMRDELRGRIDRLGLQDLVSMTGAASHDGIRDILGRARVFALPAEVADDGNRDGLPVVIVEAMASGAPVISTPVVGIPEAVRDGITGVLVPEKDPVRLAAAIESLLADDARSQALATAASLHVAAEFDLRHSAARMHALFVEAVAARGAPGMPAGADSRDDRAANADASHAGSAA